MINGASSLFRARRKYAGSRFWIERRARIIRKVQPARRCRQDRLSMVANGSYRPTEMKAEFARVQPSSGNNPPRVQRLSSRPVRVAGLLLLIGALIFVVRPLSDRSPTIDILGSYFPAWMICIISGLTLTLIAHWIVQVCHLKPYLGPAPLIYSSLTIIFTFATWILFYQN